MTHDARHRISLSLLGATLIMLAPLSALAHESKSDDRGRDDRRRGGYEDSEDRHHRKHHRRPQHQAHDDGAYHDESHGGWSKRLDVGGGWFAPWQGRSGHQEQVAILGVSPSGHFRVGAEFVHREFKTRVFDVENVDVDAYQGNIVLHGVLNPGHFTPYVGVGLGLHANNYSKNDIQRGNPALDVRDDVGLGYGVFGILGVELPIGARLALYAEGRLNLAYQVTGIDKSTGHAYADYYHDRVDKVQSEDMGGGSAVFGARLRF